MKRIFLCAVFVTLLGLAGSGSLYAQTGTDGTGTGGTGTGGTGTGGTGGSSVSSGSSSSSGSEPTQFDEAGVTPTAREIDRDSNISSFPGFPSNTPFIGREQSFETVYSRSGNSSQAATARTSRGVSSTRSRAGSTSMGRTSSANASQVRAQTTTDFQFSPPEIDFRTTAFRSRMTRLPSLRIAPEQVDISIDRRKGENIATLSGTVASTRDRKLLQNLLLLEPGIDRVDNRLEVATTPGRLESLPQLDPAAN